MTHTVDGINDLKEIGNQCFKREDYYGSVECYTKAILALEMSCRHTVSRKDRAMLYVNRAESFMQINQLTRAFEDAKRSVSVDNHWYKGHLQVRKALRALFQPVEAMRAFINAYKLAGQEVIVKLEIVMELCELYPLLVQRVDLKQKLPDFPSGDGHIWAQAVLQFTATNRWDMAQHAYHQYQAGKTRKNRFNGSLQSLCNLTKLQQYTWAVDMVQYFLDCGAKRNTVTIEKGDTYMHAAVRMDLVAGKATKFVEYMMKKFCGGGSREHHILDHHGNTILHIAARETGQNICPTNRQRLITLLLRHNLDPNLKNKEGKLAIDYVPQPENQSKETLRMAMYEKETMHRYTVVKPSGERAQTSREGQAHTARKSKPKVPQGCDNCEKMLSEAEGYLAEEHVSEGYQTLAEVLKQSHKGARHEQILKRAIELYEVKLGESDYPEIPNCLTEICKDFYLQIVEGLASRGKWRQMDALVRKYRAMKGSNQLKGFAAAMSVVPVISDSSLKTAENTKLQIVTNLLSSGATFGSDNSISAIQCAQQEDHYKVVAKLIRDGVDTSSLTMAIGDTPIHAALSIVLEKEKVPPSLLEFLLDQYKSDPEKYQHLDPEQLDDNGDSLFHILAKAKHNSTVIKVTEMLCKRNLSGHYFNKEGKLPIHYIVKKNDRRQQYLKLADGVKPSREQSFQRESGHQEVTALDDKDLQQFLRSTDQHKIQEVTEVKLTHSVNEKRKRNISELIQNLPKSKSSLFGRVKNISAKTSEEGFDDGNSDTSGCNSKIPKPNQEADVQLDNDDDTNPYTNNSCDTYFPKEHSCSAAKSSSEQKKAQRQQETVDSSFGDAQEFFDAVQTSDNLFMDELKSIEPTSVGDGETVKKNRKQPSFMTQASEEAPGIGDQALDMLDNGKAIFTDGKRGTKLASDPEIGLAEDTVIDHKLQTGDEEEEAALDEGVNEFANRDQVAEEPRKEMEESESEDEAEEKFEEDLVIDAQVFDNMEWEVECTAEVWKTLRDRQVTAELKRRIVHKIQLLASGDWQPHLCKPLKHRPPSMQLFEAKFSKGYRILWELAIAFSPRLSEKPESRMQLAAQTQAQVVRRGQIYSDIIRVWDIVLDHDKIYRSVQNIKRSHDQGEKCIIQKKLIGLDKQPTPMSFTKHRYPQYYKEKDDNSEDFKKTQQFFPPASAKDTEYHILKFYSFSSVLVSHVLQNVQTKVDFPFRVTDLEHAIIHLQSKAPILLLGRSGTGKTTCCLYRLWSQFHTYWSAATASGAPMMPRGVEFVHLEARQCESEEEEEAEGSESSTGEEVKRSDAGACSSIHCDNNVHDDQNLPEAGECDHLHQVFITKNSVLCSEVQKNFRELSHAQEMLVNHVQHEQYKLPVRLQDISDFAFPLFLTSRQLLLMLDASLGPPHFFERKDDGTLKMDIAGWSDMDGPLSFLPLLDEDSDEEVDGDAEDEDVEETEWGEVKQGTRAKKKMVDPRREIAYMVFVKEIWPKIKKDLNDVYHPSLVWIEIMSFIKGSYEALSKPFGYLTLEEYEKLGRKRAPNFPGQREVIYNCFTRYDQFKKKHSMFDETDLVHNIFCRLQQLKMQPWVIHQIFVDETQDFTQAELCLMIRLCQNPNEMFLTGDTAQSIMRGIAFRFSDLRSLFYHAKKTMQAMGKTSAVEVPKQVYQLTHNYRSHAGILALASSILELMVHFFPESFDRLQPDQGLFNGPRPILLESCSFSDLAILLRGNKRKTSHIEFGAHQTILVVNDTARECVPEELRLGLVLTISEAKGLEFDDVLLYNFFKDSQANKEWQVVTSYLEQLANLQQEKPGETDNSENLVMIDEEVLAQKGRPRPLDFDPSQHKVLNSELKHLYTALTRAWANVWIFDEDMEKRAPMFEFFKARKLVKSVTVSEINEESLSETVFAEKSSLVDWLRRGEDFMKLHLYQVAAKCFGMGQDLDQEKVALAHHQALIASRLKNDRRQMRAEFLIAAEMYLQCNQPAKAAVCLRNARENEMAAELFEKLGLYDRAADVYRRLKQPIASSRCYKQHGNFNKAVEVLFENKEYVMAIDTLRRYKILEQDCEQKNLPDYVYLRANRPAALYTEEKLSHRAAEMFHRNHSKQEMLEAVDWFQNVDDQVQFLELRGYIRDAANCLKTHGQLEKAAAFLLKFGHLDESVLAARETQKESVIAHYLLAKCRILIMTKEQEKIGEKNDLQETIKEAIQLFQTCKNHDGLGQAWLLQAELTGEVKYVLDAWRAFARSSPVPNETGLIECANWLVISTKLEDKTVLQHVVKSVGYVFKMCRLLLDKLPQALGIERLKKLYQFYGLQPCSVEKLAIHPLEKPRCLTLLKDMLKTKADWNKSYTEVKTTMVRETLVMFLLNSCKLWLQSVFEALQLMRDRERLCNYYQAGLECPNQGNFSCVCLHSPQTKEGLEKLLGINMLWAELEHNVQEASALTCKNFAPAVTQLAYSFLEGNGGLSEKFQACRFLWDDLMPAYGHCALIGDNSKALISYLRRNDKVKEYFRRYLDKRWTDAIKEQKEDKEKKPLKCKAVRETDIFVMNGFAYHLLGFDQCRMQQSPKQLMTTLENELDREVQGKEKWDFQRKKYFYTLMISEDKQTKRLSVECIARRFYDAYELMTGPLPDPFEAVFKFSKFMYQLSMRDNVAFLPDMKAYLFWLEFYTVIAIIVIAKLKYKAFPEFVFILPSSYLQLVKFVEATFPSKPAKSFPVLESINWWNPSHSLHTACTELEKRLKFYAFTVSGHEQGVHLMKEVLRTSQNDPNNYCLVERLMILAMVLVCNIGKALAVECERSLLETLSMVHIPPEGPERLRKVVKMIQDSRGIADVARALIWLMKERKNWKENLLINQWRPRMRNKVDSRVLEDLSLFDKEFLNPGTAHNINTSNHEPDEASLDEKESLTEVINEPDQTEEELQKAQADKQAMRRQKAAQIILCFLKRVRDMRRQGSGEGEFRSTSSCLLFAAVDITSNWCGVCGVYFEKILEEETKAGESGISVSQSVDPQSPLIFPNPTSPQQTNPFTWGAPEVGTSENQEIKENQILVIRKKHEAGEQHQTKLTEFQHFADKYKDKIEPQLVEFKEFLYNPDFLLSQREYREKNYDRYKEEIEKMMAKCSHVEQDIQRVVENRTWAQWNTIDQTIQEIRTELQIIRPYVEEVYKKLKQEEEEKLKQPYASASAENIEDEDDDIEVVVKDPKVAPRHGKQHNRQLHKHITGS